MTQPNEGAAGDYGYDLAHEATASAPGPRPAARPEQVGPARTGTSAGQAEDYGYDESHNF